jgi:hypothetical protein
MHTLMKDEAEQLLAGGNVFGKEVRMVLKLPLGVNAGGGASSGLFDG